MSYDVVKAIHIICFVAWFAGLFYLPRLYVYHASNSDKAVWKVLKTMEYKLYFYIATPAMVATLLSGVVMLKTSGLSYMVWMQVKLGLVLMLVAYHLSMYKYLRNFKLDKNTHSHRFFRFYNEIPSIFLIVIVLLAVLKP